MGERAGSVRGRNREIKSIEQGLTVQGEEGLAQPASILALT